MPLREPDEDVVPLSAYTHAWQRPVLAALVGFVRRGGAKRRVVERFALPLLVEAGFLVGE